MEGFIEANDIVEWRNVNNISRLAILDIEQCIDLYSHMQVYIGIYNRAI